jgi:transposase
LKPKQDAIEYQRLSQELKDLLSLEEQGKLTVYFADESGFSLTPSIPYGWQPIGQYTGIIPQKSKRQNIFGLLSTANHFVGYDTTGTINADLMIAFIDDFAQNITQKTVIILDNAPFHKSYQIEEKRLEWEEQGLHIWFLPTYSPHLNRIETLWRKAKYEWLKPSDYDNWDTLLKALDNIFTNIGVKYKIKFT